MPPKRGIKTTNPPDPAIFIFDYIGPLILGHHRNINWTPQTHIWISNESERLFVWLGGSKPYQFTSMLPAQPLGRLPLVLPIRRSAGLGNYPDPIKDVIETGSFGG